MIEATQLQNIAAKLVSERFPNCQISLLAGSVARGEAHAGSDLDIVVIDEQAMPHWETILAEGWPVELFVFTSTTIRQAFEMDARRRWPLHLDLCINSITMADHDGQAEEIKEYARQIYAAGPNALTEEEISGKRYDLTWMLDDLNDAASKEEKMLIGHDLLIEAADLYMVSNRHWRGRGGKWTERMLKQAAPTMAQEMITALAALYAEGNARPAQLFSERILAGIGGRRFEGQIYAYEF